MEASVKRCILKASPQQLPIYTANKLTSGNPDSSRAARRLGQSERLARRGHPDLLLARTRLRRSHRFLKLQSEKAGLPARRTHHRAYELVHLCARLCRHLRRAWL